MLVYIHSMACGNGLGYVLSAFSLGSIDEENGNPVCLCYRDLRSEFVLYGNGGSAGECLRQHPSG